ncbi:sensor histidine kinase [Flexithrix dorotheae]|uniref:sensor histidine kinase n=1 Tax=Flexithrix dorotheae TaxID=70993 RepID=UPI000376D4DC|nr:histidine kinase [Flexithrix dorotheae]
MAILSGKNLSPVLGVFIQALIWLSFLFLIPLSFSVSFPEVFWIKQGILVLVLLGVYYFNSLVLVPRLLLNNKLIAYLGAIAICIGLVLVFMQLVENSLNLPELLHQAFKKEKPYKPAESWFRFDFFMFLISLLVFGVSTSIALINNRNQERETRQAFEKEKISAELSNLKSQINPHFYFNILNSIYALTSTDAKLAQKAIHMLSKMMRYVLYDSQKKEVLLSQEIAFIENYLELMRLRLTDKAEVLFQKPQAFKDLLVAPMILMPFVENAFKHGIIPGESCKVEIKIEQTGDELRFLVKNDIYITSGLDIEKNSGIGLANTRRRLELLYPGTHELTIEENQKNFRVVLLLHLASVKQFQNN